MTFETVFSVAMLAGFIWAVSFLLPKAVKERDALALSSALLTAVLALLAWLLVGVRVIGQRVS
jgi:hypothetical protein